MVRPLLIGLTLCGALWAQPPEETPAASPTPYVPGGTEAPNPGPLTPTPPPLDLSLPEAALTALKNHPDLKISQAQIDQAQAAIRTASAPFYPSLRGNMRFSYSEAQNPNVGGQNVVRSGGVRNYNVGVSASQLLTDFGRTQSAVDAADESKRAAEWQKGDAVQTLLLRVSESYFTVLRAHQDVEINRDNVRNAEVQVNRAKGFFEAGTRAKIEVTRAEADLATAQVGLIKAQNDEQKAMASFLASLGAPPAGPPVALQDSKLAPPAWNKDEAVTKAREARPDLLAAFARLRAAEARVRNAEAQYYPSFSANYSYAWSEQTFIPTPYNWNVGVVMSVPLIDEPTLNAGVQSAEAQRVQAEGNQELLALQIQQQAVEAWLNLQESRSRLVAAQAALRSNEENYRLASERYNVGVGSSLEVSDAQRLLVQARSQEVQARYDVQLAIARLYRQAGSLTLEALLPKS